MVSIGFNNRIESSEAARLIGCSYSHIMGLIKSKKLKAQKLDNHWWVEHSDAERYKLAFKPRTKPVKNDIAPNRTEIKLEIDKSKLDLLSLVLQKQGKNLPQYLNEKITELCQKIDTSLSSIQV